MGWVALLAALCRHRILDALKQLRRCWVRCIFFPEFVWLLPGLLSTGSRGFRGSVLLRSTGARGTEPPGCPDEACF